VTQRPPGEVANGDGFGVAAGKLFGQRAGDFAGVGGRAARAGNDEENVADVRGSFERSAVEVW